MKTNLLFKIFTVFLIAISIGFYSCTSRQYGKGFAAKEVAYMHKPVYSDTASSANYITGAVAFNGIYEPEDKNVSGELSFHRSNTFKYVNAAYGGYGFFGNYQLNSLYGDLNGNKNYYGFGLRGNVNLNIPFKHVDWRILGVMVDINYETGNFRKFRNENEYNYGMLFYDRHPNAISNTFGLNTELVAKLDKTKQLGVFAAASVCTTEEDNSPIATVGVQFSYKPYGLSLTYSEAMYMTAGALAFRLHYQF